MAADLAHPERLEASLDLDRKPTLEVVRLLQAEEARVAPAVAAEATAIAAAVDGVVERLRGGGTMFYVGAGTSARIAQLDATELPPTFGTSPDLVQVILAGGERALGQAVEGAEDDRGAAAAEVQRRVNPRDAVVGIAASGTTPFTVSALRQAQRLGAFTVAVTARRRSPLTLAAEVTIAPDTGPEAIMGSTRLKAATAQKMVLNTLSTAVMVRLGRVYSNLMVEMPASNLKLAGRAVTMVELAAEVSPEAATEALAANGGRVKEAILTARRSLSPAEARELLSACEGDLRRALLTAGDGQE